MYDYLQGQLVRREPARIVVEVAGVGYDVAVAVGSEFPETDSQVRVWTHLVVREDAQKLFGFPDPDARTWFRSLLAVRGIGPALALGILSGLSTDRLMQALLDKDPAPLVAIRGVGRKTAEQILLDLRDRAPQTAGASPAAASSDRSRAMLDAVQALVSIGYKEKEAHRSVEHAASRVDRDDLEALVRTALQE